MRESKSFRGVVGVILLGIFCCLSACSLSDSGTFPLTTSSDEARSHYQQGLANLDRFLFVLARESFDKALAADPEFAMAYLSRSMCQPHTKGVLSDLETAIGLIDNVSEGERLLILAAKADVDGDPAAQREYCRKLVELYPMDVRAHDRLGRHYFSQQEYRLAADEYQAVIKLAPDFSPAYNMLGYTYRYLDSLDAAAAAFKRYLELIPDAANPHDSYAELLTRMGKREKAIEHYRKSLAIDPYFAASRLGIAANLTFLERPREALAELQILLDSAIDDGQRLAAHRAMAVSYVDRGIFDKALEAFREVLAVSRAIHDTAGLSRELGTIGYVLLESGKPQEAAATFEEALNLVESSGLFDRIKENSRLEHIRLQSYVALYENRLGEARTTAEQYLELMAPLQNPFRIRAAHHLLGRIALQEGQFEEAVIQLEQGNTMEASTNFYLAEAYEGKGDLAHALELYQGVADYNAIGALGYAFIRRAAIQKVIELTDSTNS